MTRMPMHYIGVYDENNVAHAGYGYILVDDIPDSGVAKYVKAVFNKASKDYESGEKCIYFQCHVHNNCAECEHAVPLVPFGVSEKDVYVEFTTKVSKLGNTKTIKIDIEATEDPSMNCPHWTNPSDLTVSWTVTKTGSGYDWSITSDDSSSIDNASGSATSSTAVKTQIKDAITADINDAQKGIWIDKDNKLGTKVNNIVIPGTGTSSGTFTLSVYTTSDSQKYWFKGASAWQYSTITLELTKTITSGYTDLLSNPLYDLSTVYFDVYTAQTGGTKLGTITIHVNKSSGTGTGKLTDIPAKYAKQPLYIEEGFPDNSNVIGYEDKGRIRVDMKEAGKTTYVTVENTPINDPVSIQIKKDSNLNGGNWIGTYDRSGIEYTLEYYTSKSAASSGSGAFRTWKFETNSNGEIDCDSSIPISGTPFTTSTGDRFYPVGWYRFYESTSESELNRRGLELNEKKYYLTVEDDGSGDGITTVYTNSSFSTLAPNTWNNATTNAKIYQKSNNLYGTIEPEHWETFSFTKRDMFLNGTGPTGDATFAGIQFKLYCESNVFNGSTTYEGHTYSINSNKEVVIDGKPVILTADASGKVTCSYKLPKEDTNGRRFYVMETFVPTECGYKTPKPNTNTYYIDWNNANPTTDTTVKNTPRMGKIVIHKRDDDSKDHMAQGDASLEGIQFAIVNASKHSVHVDGDTKDIAVGAVVKIVTTNKNGEASAEKLPYGTYKVYELSEDAKLNVGDKYTENAAGSSIYANKSKSYLVSDDKLIGTALIHPTDDSNTSVTQEFTVENSVVRADLRVKKVDTEMTDVQGDASLAGIQYAIVNSSKKSVKVNGTTYNVGKVVDIITTNEAGIASISTANSLPYGTYTIYELRSDTGVTKGCDYSKAKKGTSIYANNAGYLFTETVSVAKNSVNSSDYNMNSRSKQLHSYHTMYTADFSNVVSNGKLTVQKFDDDTTEEQGDTSFNGIKFAVVNRSDHPVYYENHKCGVGTVVAVHTTATVDGVNGIAVFNNLPYGSYQVYELGRGATITPNTVYPSKSTDSRLGDTKYANDSYMLKNPGNPNRQVSGIEEIHPDNVNRTVIVEDEIANTPARGTVTISKYDTETLSTKYKGTYQGDANFEGIRYAIVNNSKKFVKIDGVIYPKGTVVAIISTNANGYAALDAKGKYSLPYGTYDIHELRKDATINVHDTYANSTKLGTSIWANDHGYLYTEDTNVAETDSHTTFTIDKRTQKVYLDANSYKTQFTNVIAKGTITVQKNDGDISATGTSQGDASLAGIKYAVVNRSKRFIERFGEVYEPGEIVDIRATDANGVVKFDTDGHYTFPYGTYEVIELRYDNTLSKHDIYDGNSKIGTSPLANQSYVFTEDKTVAEVGENTNYVVDTKTHILRDPKSTYEPEYTNYAVKGTVVINKQDVETVWAQGDEDFANIRYAIVNRSALPIERNGEMYDVGEVVAIIKTNHDGVAKLDEDGKYTLPYGTYELCELRSDATIMPGDTYNGSTKLGESIYANSTGFLYTADVAITKVDTTTNSQFTMASQTEKVRTLKETYTHTFKNAPAKGTLTLIKYDANLTDKPILDNSNKEYKQGDANTAGIQYAVINVSKDPVTGEPRKVMYKGVIYDVNSVIDILTVKEEDNYEARLDKEGEFSLNYGTYWVYELRKDHQLHVGDSYPIDNPTDPVLGTSIYSNDNGYMHNDKEAFDTSAILKVTVDGVEVDDYNKYEVTRRDPVIHRARTRFDYSFFNYPARGEIYINKFDDETDLQKHQGNNRFTGIKYAIVNKSAVHVYYKDQIFEPGTIIDILELDDSEDLGNARATDVPYGTYDIHELRRDSELAIGDVYPTSDSDETWSKLGTSIYANKWYLYCDEVFTKVINANNPVYTVNPYLGSQIRIAGKTYSYKYSDAPIRSDFEHNKVDIDGYSVPFIPYAVSLLDDNGEILETHVIITDKDGYINTRTRQKDVNTVNTLDQYYDKAHGRYVGPLDEAAANVNIWFGNIEDYYDTGVICNKRGSLLAGTYYIQELYCENNVGQDMLKHSFDAFEENALNKPKNISVDLNIIMKSDAYDYGTDSKTLSISTAAKIRDTVDITHLKTYNEYKLITEAVNVRKDGSWVTLGFSDPYIFTPDQYDETMTTYGTYDVIAVFDTTSAEPGTYVGLIDRLYQKVNGEWTSEPIRIHNGDLTDDKQKLLVPDITTSATNLETGSLIGSIEPATAASDKIIYKYLGDKSFFNVEVLVTNEDGDIINDVNGNPCRQSYFLYTNDASATKVERINNVFTSPTSGEIDLHEFGLEPFTVADEYDTIGMVVTLYDATTGEVVLSHNTKMDEADEIIKYLRIGTVASDNTGYVGIIPCTKDAELVDTINYTNLVKSTDVTVVGAVVDKSTGEIVTTATRQYSLTEGDGQIDIKFTFNSLPYAGKELVVFERVYLNYEGKEILISKHEDINDKSQTVTVPKLETTLLNVHNGEGYKVVSAVEENVTLVDYVEYTGLIPGDPWTLTANLMDATTGKPVLDANGKEVIATHTFTPSMANGIEPVEINFTFKHTSETTWTDDASWVCFEDLKSGTSGRETITYATHADIEDKDQTVFIPKFRTEARNANTDKHLVIADKNQTVTDTVEFRNFVAAVKDGQKFTLKIEAMDASTGLPILDSNGVPYSNTKLFTWNGQPTESIDITFDATNLGGKTIVFFETLFYGDSTNTTDRVLVEDDIDSTAQSVLVPAVSTLAVDKATNSKNLSLNKSILDKVMLSGVCADTDYIIKTMIVDKETGKFIKTADGDDYVAITTFHSPEGQTSNEIDITLDVSNTEDITNKDIVIYEYVYMVDIDTEFENLDDSQMIVKHTDINDNNQTIEVPEIHTTATDKVDGDHIIDGTKTEQTIIDTVTYNNLIVGNEYTVTGKLVVKPTNGDTSEYTYVTDDDGNIIEVSTTFVAETSTGTVDIPFTIDASKYAGKKLVAFETLSYEGVDLAIHADIDDEEQTIFVSLRLHVNIVKADFDDVSYVLKGAEITIFNADGTVAKDINGKDCIGVTDENGAVDFVVLYDENNTFYAQETKAPEGYQLCEDKFIIRPSDDKESLGTDLIKINVLDEIIIIPPYTGDAMTYVAIAALGVGILGLGALFIVKRKKSKKNKDNK